MVRLELEDRADDIGSRNLPLRISSSSIDDRSIATVRHLPSDSRPREWLGPMPFEAIGIVLR